VGNIRRKKTNMKKDNKNKQGIKDKGDNMEDIGENTFLKLREEKLRLKEELEQVKIQRDIALKRLKKISTTLASVVEYINGSKKK
jgi:Skp family chaperone for outer membrane proteins